MKAWFGSLSGAITLSALSLIGFVGYALLEMRYFLGRWIPGDGAAMVETLAFMLIAGGWLWALLVAASGRRGGLMALLAFSAFTTVVALYELQWVFSTSMPWPEETGIWSVLGLSVLALAALIVQHRQRQTAG